MLILIIGGESDNLSIFTLSKLIALALLFLNHLILVKYTKLYE